MPSRHGSSKALSKVPGLLQMPSAAENTAAFWRRGNKSLEQNVPPQDMHFETEDASYNRLDTPHRPQVPELSAIQDQNRKTEVWNEVILSALCSEYLYNMPLCRQISNAATLAAIIKLSYNYPVTTNIRGIVYKTWDVMDIHCKAFEVILQTATNKRHYMQRQRTWIGTVQ